MTFTLSLTLGWIIVILISLVLLVVVTFFCYQQGLFDGGRDTYGIGGLFMILFYLGGWALPSSLIVITKLLFFA